MKNVGLLLLALIIANSAFAQDCVSYAPMQEGKTFEMTNYDRKDKMTSKSIMKVTKVETSNGVTTAQIDGEIFDQKGKILTTNGYEVKCDGTTYSADMASYMSGEQLAAMGDDIDVEIDGDWLVLPSTLAIGDELTDGKITAKASTGGTTIMSFSMNIKDRTVVASEKVSTPAGEFDAMKVTYNYNSKMAFITLKGSAEEWWVKDIGVVKSVSYNKKGKKVSTSMLTAFN